MTSILDQIRNTTVADLENTRSDFDDLGPATYTRRVPKNMVRIVEGSDDLKPTTRSTGGSGMVGPGRPATGAILTADGRTERQAEVMRSLLDQLATLDHATAEAAAEYTTRMTVEGKWTSGREGNASDWIGRMIRKVRELKANPPVVVTAAAPKFDSYDDIPTGYYALVDDAAADVIKFYRVKHGRVAGRVFVDACASDERHPVRVWSTRKAVLDGIRAMGWKASTALYGSKIGSCGRCHRSLTDADSRARGIGPDCWGKM